MDGVDAAGGNQLLVGPYICRREAEIDAPVVSGDHLSCEVVWSAQKRSGIADFPCEDGLSDPCAADGLVADLKGADHLDFKSQSRSGGGQEGFISLLPPAEGVVMTDDDFPNPEPFPKHVMDELLRRGPGVFEGKRDQDEGVDPEV